MPRPRSHTPQDLADRALEVFWTRGFEATSMDDLVRATRVSRHGIYSDFGGKRDLFLACFERYQRRIVTPAFGRVERPGATLEEVGAYFEHQISLAERMGLPGPGCFVGNAITEVAPHDAEVRTRTEEHNDRLRSGFATAVRNSCAPERTVSAAEIRRTAEALLVFATGLWAMSRLTADGTRLREAVTGCLMAIRSRLT